MQKTRGTHIACTSSHHIHISLVLRSTHNGLHKPDPIRATTGPSRARSASSAAGVVARAKASVQPATRGHGTDGRPPSRHCRRVLEQIELYRKHKGMHLLDCQPKPKPLPFRT